MSTSPSFEPMPNSHRHNFYHAIHKALRLGHGRMLAAIGSTDFSNAAAAVRTIDMVREFLMLGRSHLEGENREIHAALEVRVPGASAHAADDHEGHEQSFAELETMLRAIEMAPAAEKNRAALVLYHRYALFAAHDFEHMHEEETELLAALHEAFTDDELRAIEGRIVAAIPPAKMAAYLKIMMPAMNQPERSGMLEHMRDAMPAPVFETILNEAVRPSLDPAAFAAATASLRQAA